jgi:nitrous oxidase accessory protein NosD
VTNSKVKIIRNKIARSAAFGITIFNSQAEIRDNILEDNVLDSIFVTHVDGQPSEVQIIGNTISGTKPDNQGRFGRGIEIVLSRAVIANNTISNNAQFGIIAFGAGGGEGEPPLEIRDNTIAENGLWGVALLFEEDFGIASKAVLTGNTISKNAGVGVVAFESSTVLAVNNRVTDQSRQLCRGRRRWRWLCVR